MLGGPLESCGTDPLTGFYRDGLCRTGAALITDLLPVICPQAG